MTTNVVLGKDVSGIAGVGIAAFYGGENVQYTTIAEEKAGEHGAIIEILQRAAAEGMLATGPNPGTEHPFLLLDLYDRAGNLVDDFWLTGMQAAENIINATGIAWENIGDEG